MMIVTGWSSICLQKRERDMQQEIENQEESALNLKETYDSLQQEVEIKTKKLKKVGDAFNYDTTARLCF